MSDSPREASDNDASDQSGSASDRAESCGVASNLSDSESSGSAEDCSDTYRCEGDAGEFCLIFSGERLPNSDMTVRDAMLTLMAYTVSVALNWTGMEKLVGIINLFLGKPVLPTSSWMLRKACRQWMDDLVKRHYFCQACEAVISNPRQKVFSCPHCTTEISGQNLLLHWTSRNKLKSCFWTKQCHRA